MSTLAPGPARSRIPCWYWLNGGCYNPSCRFLHPPYGAIPVYGLPKSSIPCYFFLRGNCNRGANCAFKHAPPSVSPIPSQQNLPPTRSSNSEVNTPPPQEQNNCSIPSDDNESDSEDDMEILVEDDPSYFLNGEDWYGPHNYLSGNTAMGSYGSHRYNYYSPSESASHRPGSSGSKRPLEQEAESEIKLTDAQPERKKKRLNAGAVTVPDIEIRVAD